MHTEISELSHLSPAIAVVVATTFGLAMLLIILGIIAGRKGPKGTEI